MNGRFETIDHTADLGIRAYGTDLKQLFENAAYGMFELLWGGAEIEQLQGVQVDICSDDLPGLLVDWLSEINYLHATDRLIYSRVRIDELDAKAGSLRAELAGEPYDASRHLLHTEIKAVTYHELDVLQTEQGWQAQVIFDV